MTSFRVSPKKENATRTDQKDLLVLNTFTAIVSENHAVIHPCAVSKIGIPFFAWENWYGSMIADTAHGMRSERTRKR